MVHRLGLYWLALLTPALAQAPALTSGQEAKLEKGEVVLHKLRPTNNSGVAAWAVGLVNAPVAKVWPVLRDCGRYSEFMPRTKSSQLISRAGDTMECKVIISMPFPFSNLWSHVQSKTGTLPGGGHIRAWRLLKGNYKRNRGSWSVLPWKGDAGRTLLVYRLDVDPDMLIPDAIIRAAQTGYLPDVFTAVRKRVGAP